MSVTGERGYSSEGRVPVKMTFEPVKPGDYELTLVGASLEVKIAQASGMPYVNAAFTMGGTAADGGNDRRVYKRFGVSLEPREKTGRPVVDEANELLGFSKATGAELNFGEDAITTKSRRKDDGTVVQEKCLDPAAVKAWLQQFDGSTVRGHVRIKRASEKDKKAGYSDQNEISHFIEA